MGREVNRGARVEGSTLFEEAQVGEGTVARNLIVGLGTMSPVERRKLVKQPATRS
jgi:hypothetical protein